MHEHSFIEKIIENIPNRENIVSVVIEVGELVGIEPDHLKEHLIEYTNWNVEIVIIKSKVECICGYKGEAHIRERLHDIVIYDCPRCGLVPEVIKGNTIKVLKATYKD